MGQALQLPSIKLTKHHMRLKNFHKCNMMQLHEAYDFFIHTYSSRCHHLNKEGFEEIFGQFFGDPDGVFMLFVENVDAPQLTIDPHVVFCAFILLCSDSMTEKINMLHSIHMDEHLHGVGVPGLNMIFARTTIALHRIFDLTYFEGEQLVTFVNGLITFYTERQSKESKDDLSFTTLEFMQFCQDTQDVWSTLEALDVLMHEIDSKEANRNHNKKIKRIRNSILKLHGVGAIPIRPPSPVEALEMPRHPLWQYSVADIADDSWAVTMPTLSSEDMVFTVLEHMVLGGRRCLPVYLLSDNAPNIKSRAGGGGESNRGNASFFPPTPTSSSVGMDKGSSSFSFQATTSSRHTSSSHPYAAAPPSKFYALIDGVTLLQWMASSCPSTITTEGVKMETARVNKESSALAIRRKNTVVDPKAIGKGPNMTALRNASVLLSSQGMGGARFRERDKSNNVGGSQQSNAWYAVGETVATSPARVAREYCAAHR